MIIQSFFKYLLSDRESLNKYFRENVPVLLFDVRRSLMLIAREQNVSIPDHYYRLAQEKTFENIDSISQLFTKGMLSFAEEYLEWNSVEKKVYTKADKQNEWQLIMPFISPLFMQSLIIWKNTSITSEGCESYINKNLIPNFTYTAIPHPNILQLKHFVSEQNGLHDLHIHLNGSLETDRVWQDYLEKPDIAYADFQNAIQDEKVQELYSEQSPFLTPTNFKLLLHIARYIRYTLYTYIFRKNSQIRLGCGSLESFLLNLHQQCLNLSCSPVHPIYNEINADYPIMYAESLFYIKVLDYMSAHKENDFVSCLFHYYLLIWGQMNKMLVQQISCNGFEEFQKYTLGYFRGFSEETYNRRFFQLSGNELTNIRVLEGRFSPKNTLGKDERLLEKVRKGWEELNRVKRINGRKDSELLLVAHFIKEPDKKPDLFVRFKSKRKELAVKAEVLVNLLNSKSLNSKLVRSVDAAASEFDTPPEVFSSCYRFLRKHGYHHFTYHAGEDFFHLLSGLRAIFEAVVFLDLRAKDRIGHATACGVPVDVWLKNIGEDMLIRQGEYLDNLVFAYYIINEYGDHELKALMASIALQVENLCTEVYGVYYPISLQIQAWLKRYQDPEALIEKKMNEKHTSIIDSDDIFLQYHRADITQRYNKIIKIKTEDVLDRSVLTKIQLLILKMLHDREIVIETLPTSNVIIGHHHSFKTYHLYNWYKWGKEGKSIPPIVVGSDDAGIFATNIYNEYCNIYCQLMYYHGMNSNDIMKFIQELDANSTLYKFD